MQQPNAAHCPLNLEGLEIATDLFRQIIAVDWDSSVRALERRGIRFAPEALLQMQNAVHEEIFSALRRAPDTSAFLPHALQSRIVSSIDTVIGREIRLHAMPILRIVPPNFSYES